MFSYIATYMDKKDRPLIAIGNKEYINQLNREYKQRVNVLIISHSQQWLDEIMSLEQEELQMVLEQYMEDNELLVDRPN